MIMQICIDFDGTCTTHDFPRIGKDIGAEVVLKTLVDEGHQLILFTMRSDGDNGDFLTHATEWFTKHGIPLFGVQKNPEQITWTSSPKAYGQLYIDDATLGAPLWNHLSAWSDRPFINWYLALSQIHDRKLISNTAYFKCVEQLKEQYPDLCL